MQYNELKLSALLLLGIGLTELQAQETVAASGGNASGSGGTVSYSIGQTMYTTSTGTTGSVAQGVQQPYEISVVTGLEEAKDISLQYLVYPNPATDILILKIEGITQSQGISSLHYITSLYDMNGRIIENKKIEDIETAFSMNDVLAGTYFLKVIQSGKEIKTFKIIKN